MYKAVVFVLVLAALVAFVAFESHVAAISKPHAAGDAGPWLAARRPRRRPAAAASPAREVRAAALRARAAAARADAAATRAAASEARAAAAAGDALAAREASDAVAASEGGDAPPAAVAASSAALDDDEDDRPPLVAGAPPPEGPPCDAARVRYWAGGLPGDAALVASGRVPPATAPEKLRYLTFVPDLGGWNNVRLGAAKESEIPNFKGSYLGRFPLVSADFWTSDHLSGRSRRVDAFVGTRARGTLTLKRR